ncbi:MAG: DUF2147 domain-containing protein [Cyclobacteriaceae bacterium]|nr:DUF2147 domain-containing protein [Cyclobacteriaceae bacterium]
METYYPILYLIVSFAIAVFSALLIFKLKNSKSRLESQLTGIWVNESQTMRILLHNIDSVFQGDIIWINSIKSDQQHVLGARLIKDLILKTIAQGSAGIYVDPKNGEELPFRIWFKGKGRLKIALIKKVSGKEKVVREEEWSQLQEG